MSINSNYTDFLKNTLMQFNENVLDCGILSILVELPSIEIIDIYKYFIEEFSFSAYWDEKDKLTYVALGKCKYMNLNGPNKFQLAKEFTKEIFNNIIYLGNKEGNISSSAKVIYFFSFSDNSRKINSSDVPNVEAVLPKIFIYKDKYKNFLRMNFELSSKSSLRACIEEFWCIRNKILSFEKKKNRFQYFDVLDIKNLLIVQENNIKKNIFKAIELIEQNIIKKIVLSLKIKLNIEGDIDFINVLNQLVKNQKNTCIFLWKRNFDDITFGASPERLFSLNNKKLLLEAIAGTAQNDINRSNFLKSEKNLREHNYVVNYLIECLRILKIDKYRKSKLEVISFGDISHLCTQIYSENITLSPFDLLELLHPSPAVCGYPKEIALHWIDTLESFSRGNYAAPIGWVDSNGDSDFRVAIRGARYTDKCLEFIAGAGIVKGSVCEKELEEIRLKLNAIVEQILIARINQ